MSWLRAQRRLLGWVALCASLCSLALPVLEAHPMGAADDAACRLVPGSNDHGALGIGAPGSREVRPEHCVVCHLQRAISGAFVSDAAALTSPLLALRCTGLSQTPPVSAADATPSSRGPPAILYI